MQQNHNSTTIETIKTKQINNKSKNWLRQSLIDIENHVASDAHKILQKAKSNTFKIQNQHNNNKKQLKIQQKTLDDLKIQQKQLRDKLRSIKNQQKYIKQHKQNNSFDFKVKTNQQLKQLTRKYREFKQNLLEKSILLKQQQQYQKSHIKKLKKQQMQTICEQRRKIIKQKLSKMQKKRIQRCKQHQQQKQKLKQLKKQKLYQKMKQNFNIRNNSQNQEKFQRYKRIKKRFQINMSTLSQHQKSYTEAIRERQEKRTIRMTQSRMLPDINFYKSRFLDQIMINDNLKKEQQKQIMERKKQMHQKHKQFHQRILEQNPLIKKQSTNHEQKQNNKIALDWKQIQNKGNQYYKIGQKSALSLEKREANQKAKITQKISVPKTYPNYLAQFQKLPHPKKSQKSFFKHQLKLLQKSMKNQKLSKLYKLQQVKVLVQKMQNTPIPTAYTSEQQLMVRLNVKMKLLEMLQ